MVEGVLREGSTAPSLQGVLPRWVLPPMPGRGGGCPGGGARRHVGPLGSSREGNAPPVLGV